MLRSSENNIYLSFDFEPGFFFPKSRSNSCSAILIHAELKQIRTHLENLENASPETRGKLRQLFENIKDGSSGAIKLG